MTKHQPQGGRLISEGTHVARAISHAMGYTKNNQEQVAVEFELRGGPEAGQRISWFGMFGEKSFGFTMKALRAAGWHGQDMSNDLDGLGSVDCLLVVTHEEWEGKKSARAKWVNSLSESTLKNQMSAEDRAGFGARMKAQIAAYDKPAAAQPQQYQRPAPTLPMLTGSHRHSDGPPPLTDEDIPF